MSLDPAFDFGRCVPGLTSKREKPHGLGGALEIATGTPNFGEAAFTYVLPLKRCFVGS
jgi:hypothetical protein